MHLGSRIKFIDSIDTTFPFNELPKGTEGTVQYQENGEIGVIWDNGSSIILNEETDRYEELVDLLF